MKHKYLLTIVMSEDSFRHRLFIHEYYETMKEVEKRKAEIMETLPIYTEKRFSAEKIY